MKRFFLTFLVLIAFFAVTFATPISEDAAREKAAQFIVLKKGSASEARSAQRFGSSGRTGATLTVAEAREAFYVFNIDSVGGYVIVSGDDRMPDVLGYSYSGIYNPEEIPDNMRAWLEGYADQYAYLQSHSSEFTRASITSVNGEKIRPMLTSQWGQEEPYNNQCPTIPNGKTVTGCVATAMAQIMNYHQWPNQTSKIIPAYTTDTYQISMPEIGVTSINWGNMNNDEVAKLMKLCGCAVEMDYRLTGSGATSRMAKEAFVKFFDYKEVSINYIKKEGYSNDVWNQMMYDELANGRPIFYSGISNEGGGHAFVLDGYDGSDYFHVNWGWEGYQDSFFLLSSLNGYTDDQDAIIGIEGKNEHVDHQYPYAIYDNGTLTFYCDNNDADKTGTKVSVMKSKSSSWIGYSNSVITKVVFDPSFSAYKNLYDLSQWFYNCTNLAAIEGLEYLNTEKVADMSSMFNGCSSLENIDLSKLNTQNVSNMSSMFNDCSSLVKIDLSKLNTQNVSNMSYMFSGCSSFTNIDLNTLNTEKVTNMSGMFSSCSSLTEIDLSTLNTQNVTDMSGIFSFCSSLTNIDLSNLSTQNVTGMHNMFSNCSSLTSIDLSKLNTQNVTDMSGMFSFCSSLTNIDLSNLSTQNVTGMHNMFSNCSSLKSIDLSKLNTQNVTDMSGMFSYCSSLTNIDLSNLNTQNVTDMSSMFSYCSSLTSINISNLNTQKVANMHSMFSNCSSLTSIDLSKLNTQNVTDMTNMFSYCSSLASIDLTNLNTQNVSNMSYLFSNCSSLRSIDLSSFNTRKVTNMTSMFAYCKNVNVIYVGNFWNTSNVAKGDLMFNECIKLNGEMGTAYDLNKTNYKYAIIDNGVSSPGYFSSILSHIRGDANGDGKVTIEDVNMLKSYLLGKIEYTYNRYGADVNQDARINTEDMVYLIQYLKTGSFLDNNK